MKYTQIPETTFEEIQLNAGILADTFNPETGEVGKLYGATTGGNSFSATPTYTDYGDDIDNCPKNTMELMKTDDVEVQMTGTFVTVTAESAKMMIASADVDSEDPTHIIPRKDLKLTDFKDLWFVGDYSSQNDGAKAGFIAIHMFNALNTGGFSVKTTDKGKGNFAFTFKGHYSISEQDKVPYELYIKKGEQGNL